MFQEGSFFPKSPAYLRVISVDIFGILLFLFFVTLHADRLNVSLGGFSIRLNNLIGFLMLVGFHLHYKKEIFQIDRKLIKAISLITLSILISFLFSPYKRRCFFFMGWYVITLGVYLWLPYQMMMKWGDKILRIYFFTYLIVGVYAFVQFVLSAAGIHDPFATQFISSGLVRPNAFSYEPSFYALYMTPFVMLINFLYLKGERSFFFFRSLNLKNLLFVNALFLVSTATSALFAYFVFFGFLFLYSLQKKKHPRLFVSMLKLILLLGIVFSMLMICFPVFMKSFFLKFFVTGFLAHHSFLDRWIGIHNAWRVFLDQPFLGVGLGGYPAYLFEVWLKGDTRFIFLYQDTLIHVIPNPMKLFEAHNAFTEMLASLGLIGGGAFCYLYWTLYQQRNKVIEKTPLSEGLFLSMIVMVVVLQFNQGLLRTYVWTHFAIVFAYLKQKTLDEKNFSQNSSSLE